MARPKKTLSALPNGWETDVIALMEQGGSKVEVKALLGVSNDLFERLVKEEPLFSDTIKKGEQLSEAWWQKQGRIHLQNKEFSPVLWYMNMKNRFKWRDRQEHSNDAENPVPMGVIMYPAKKAAGET